MARVRRVCLALAVPLAAAVLLTSSGCGLQTEEANHAIAKSAESQQAAEDVLARLKNFPAEWQDVFTHSSGSDQVTRARQLVAARIADIQAFESALAAWKADLKPILELNVDDKIKEYVRLKIECINCFKEYATDYLQPILMAYEGLVEQIAYGRPQDELDRSANEITGLVEASSEKLEECTAAQRQAEDYFKESEIGN